MTNPFLADSSKGDPKAQAAKLKKKSLAICSNYLDLMAY